MRIIKSFRLALPVLLLTYMPAKADTGLALGFGTYQTFAEAEAEMNKLMLESSNILNGNKLNIIETPKGFRVQSNQVATRSAGSSICKTFAEIDRDCSLVETTYTNIAKIPEGLTNSTPPQAITQPAIEVSSNENYLDLPPINENEASIIEGRTVNTGYVDRFKSIEDEIWGAPAQSQPTEALPPVPEPPQIPDIVKLIDTQGNQIPTAQPKQDDVVVNSNVLNTINVGDSKIVVAPVTSKPSIEVFQAPKTNTPELKLKPLPLPEPPSIPVAAVAPPPPPIIVPAVAPTPPAPAPTGIEIVEPNVPTISTAPGITILRPLPPPPASAIVARPQITPRVEPTVTVVPAPVIATAQAPAAVPPTIQTPIYAEPVYISRPAVPTATQIEVGEAIPVDLVEDNIRVTDIPAPRNQEQTVSVRQDTRKTPISALGSPARVQHGSIWLQIGKFKNVASARYLYQGLKNGNFIPNNLRMKTISSFSADQEDIFMKVGPITSNAEAERICRTFTEEGVRCWPQKTINLDRSARTIVINGRRRHNSGKFARPVRAGRSGGTGFSNQSDWLAQLGTYPNMAKAEDAFDEVKSAQRRLFRGKTRLITQPANSSSYDRKYRLRVSGFDGKPQARDFCSKLKKSGYKCLAVRNR